MSDKEGFIVARLEDISFIIRIFEMYNRKMPSDELSKELCDGYRQRCRELTDENIQNRDSCEEINA